MASIIFAAVYKQLMYVEHMTDFSQLKFCHRMMTLVLDHCLVVDKRQ